MSSGTTTPDRLVVRAGRDGFARLLWAEWTKFRTVRGWVIGMMAAALVTVLVGLLGAVGTHASCGGGANGDVCPAVPVGPDGEAVTDKFYFVHQPMTGDGSITVRLTSLTGIITYPPPNHDQIVPGLVPWAKAGIMIKESTRQGSAYAAVMLSGHHGVRMQHNFTHDTAGRPGGVSATSPRWLRLTRSGDTLTGYESTNGTQWTKVGTAHLDELPARVRVGLFVASPCDLTVNRSLGGRSDQCRLTEATAVFDQVSLQGNAPSGTWSRADVGAVRELGGIHHPGSVKESGGRFTVTGNGDIAPLGAEGGQAIERTLTGTFAGLIVVIVVAAMFITAEYRRGLIRTTLAASPRRGRVLAAKAIVIGSAAFVVGLAAALVAVPLCKQILRANGNYILPATSLTELRVVAGTAALLAVAAVLALAIGALLRRSAGAVTAVIVAIVLPYLLAVAAVLPGGAAAWLLRLTPAAAFAIQQSTPTYPQVTASYTASTGYFPLAPWAGFAVLCGYAALALGLAVLLIRGRDA